LHQRIPLLGSAAGIVARSRRFRAGDLCRHAQQGAVSGPAHRLRGGAAVAAAGLRRRALSDRSPAGDAPAGGRLGVHAARPLLRRRRALYREQRDAVAETLTRRAAGRLDVMLPDQGMHLIAWLRDGSSDTAIEAEARRAGLIVRAISRFYRKARPRPGLMLGFSGFPRQLIVPAAARLATLVANGGRD